MRDLWEEIVVPVLVMMGLFMAVAVAIPFMYRISQFVGSLIGVRFS